MDPMGWEKYEKNMEKASGCGECSGCHMGYLLFSIMDPMVG
jgi:hypothetical protein